MLCHQSLCILQTRQNQRGKRYEKGRGLGERKGGRKKEGRVSATERKRERLRERERKSGVRRVRGVGWWVTCPSSGRTDMQAPLQPHFDESLT